MSLESWQNRHRGGPSWLGDGLYRGDDSRFQPVGDAVSLTANERPGSKQDFLPGERSVAACH
jgi:hypothetical protein